MKQELIKQIVRIGNSSGVILPKNWEGGIARVELVEKPQNIYEDVMGLLTVYLPKIQGIYIVGSYARGEQTKNSDIDIIAISDSVRKKIFSGKYHIEIYPLKDIKKTIEKNPLMIYPRILESKAILNAGLIKQFSKKFQKNSFKRFINETKQILKINEEIIALDKEIGDFLSSYQIIYSLILRLRGLVFIRCILSNKKYKKKDFFLEFSKKIGEKEFKKLYDMYEKIKNREKVNLEVKISVVESLVSLIKKEIKKYD